MCGGGPTTIVRLDLLEGGFPRCAGVDRRSIVRQSLPSGFPPVCGGGPG